MRVIPLAILAAVAVTFLAPAASAQYYRRGPAIYASPTSPYSGYAAPARGFYCVRECVQDTSPCDPPEYKRTDGRCTSPLTGVR